MKRLKLIIFIILMFSGCGSGDDNKTAPESGKIKTWPNGEVFYTFTKEVSDENINKIESVFNEIENQTKCIYFIRDDERKDSLLIKYSTSNVNFATVGHNKQNEISLLEVFSEGSIYHEVLHVLGLGHEHQRKDRNEFIKVNYDRIQKGYKDFFVIKDQLYNVEDFNYDGDSIMHYPPKDFSIDRKFPVIEFLDGEDFIYSMKPTKQDYAKLVSIYLKFNL